MENEKYYIAVNAGDRYPLLKTPQDYTEYFNEALSFGDLFDVLRYTAMTVCVSVKRKPTPLGLKFGMAVISRSIRRLYGRSENMVMSSVLLAVK